MVIGGGPRRGQPTGALSLRASLGGPVASRVGPDWRPIGGGEGAGRVDEGRVGGVRAGPSLTRVCVRSRKCSGGPTDARKSHRLWRCPHVHGSTRRALAAPVETSRLVLGHARRYA